MDQQLYNNRQSSSIDSTNPDKARELKMAQMAQGKHVAINQKHYLKANQQTIQAVINQQRKRIGG